MLATDDRLCIGDYNFNSSPESYSSDSFTTGNIVFYPAGKYSENIRLCRLSR